MVLGARIVLVLLFALRAGDVAALGCTGDCDRSHSVTVDEVVRCVNLALDNPLVSPCQACDTTGDGKVTVDEIVRAVNNALVNDGAMTNVDGFCLRPGPSGLVDCAVSTQVLMSRCEDRSTCLRGGGAAVATTAVGQEGTFAFRVPNCQIAGELLLFEANIDDAVVYRVLDIGPVEGADGNAAGRSGELVIGPPSEAATRYLEQSGLENFDDAAIVDTFLFYREANAGSDFSGTTLEEAVTLAGEVAVAAATATARQPTSTSTPTPSATPSPTDTREMAIIIGEAQGEPGETVELAVSLKTQSDDLIGVYNSMVFEAPGLDVVGRCIDETECRHSSGCRVGSCGAPCTGTKVGSQVWSFNLLEGPTIDAFLQETGPQGREPLPNETLLYTCAVTIAREAGPGTLPVRCTRQGAYTAKPQSVPHDCVDGKVQVLGR